jgi:hypothetical protein
LWILEKKIQILQNPATFLSFILKINPFLHVYYTKFMANFFFFTKSQNFQNFSVKINFFLQI